MNINPQAASLAQKDVQQAAMTQADINDGVVAQDCASSSSPGQPLMARRSICCINRPSLFQPNKL